MLNKEDTAALAREHSEGRGKRYTFTEESLFEFLYELKKDQATSQDEREAVVVVGWLGGNGLHSEENEATGAPFPLMTVAQHERIVASLIRPAQKVNVVDTPEQQPVKLQHMAYSEDGVLRWMTGRKIDNCELYAMPDFGRAPQLYAAPIAQTPADGLVEVLEEIASGLQAEYAWEVAEQALAAYRAALTAKDADKI